MKKEDLFKLFDTYDKYLDNSINIGFHAHNNINLAFSNTLDFINIKKSRKIIIDSCILGMGQGAGNLQTELIVYHLRKYYLKDYDYSSVLNICEIIDVFSPTPNWGYTLSRLLPALHESAYKYSEILRNKYKFSYNEINNFFSHLTLDKKNRYTISNLNETLIELGYMVRD